MMPRKIKMARADLGYKQEYVAQMLGLKTPNYCNKENGKSKFSDEEKVKLAELLNFSPEELNDYLYDGILPIGHVCQT